MFLKWAAPTLRQGRCDCDVNAGFSAPLESAMKYIECWRWRFRDAKSGRICRTMYALSEEEANKFPQAERIPGTLIMREVDDEFDFADTVPGIGFPQMDEGLSNRR